MKALTSFSYGASAASKSLRMTLYIYFAYLAIALLLAIPFFSLFKSAAGNSQLPDSLMNGFDATAIRELLASGGKYFGFYLKSLLPWIIAFFLFQIYLNGGIFWWVANPRGKFSIAQFQQFSRKYFWRYLKTSFYFLIINLIVALILYVPFFIGILGSKGLTDQQIMRPLLVLAVFHALLLVYIKILADVVKSAVFEQDTRKVWKSITRSLKTSWKRFWSFYLLGWLLLVLPLIVYLGFFLLRSTMTVSTTGMILFVFLMQQITVFLMLFLRVWRLAAVYRYYLKINND